MLTLENIGLIDDEVVISFMYEGKNVHFNGQIKLSKEQYIESHNSGDEYLHDFVECALQRELHCWINQ